MGRQTSAGGRRLPLSPKDAITPQPTQSLPEVLMIKSHAALRRGLFSWSSLR